MGSLQSNFAELRVFVAHKRYVRGLRFDYPHLIPDDF